MFAKGIRNRSLFIQCGCGISDRVAAEAFADNVHSAVELLGMADTIPVHAGALYPLVHDPDSFENERALFGFGESWRTALHRPGAGEANLVAPADGFATEAEPQAEHAVDFIIDTVRANPGEVTLLVIGPVTNIAMAVRKARPTSCR